MRILIARTRIRGTLHHFAYQVLIPFDQISAERQDRMHTRSDYGFPGHYYARTRDVIAPMEHHRSPYGLARQHSAQAIDGVAKRVDAVLVNHVYPEMTAAAVPIVFTALTDQPSSITWIEAEELTAAYERLAQHGMALSAERLGVRVLEEAIAA